MNALEDTMHAILRDAATAGFFTGACAAVFGTDGAIAETSAGDTGCERRLAVKPDCLFDLASLTKPFVATAMLVAVQEGAVDLHSPVRHVLPQAQAAPCGDCTIEELLTHESGLPAWLPLFEQIPPQIRGTAAGSTAVYSLALSAPVDSTQRGTALYSDIGFILLGRALEVIFAQPLDEIVESRVISPLCLDSVAFRRLDAENRTFQPIAATELCHWRGRLLVGEVHDDNAWAAGGVSGQAGLFGTARDVARFGAAWLSFCLKGGLLSAELARRAIARRPSGRALCWDCRNAQGSSAGTLLGPCTFGHLGFTGCSLWVDPEREVSIALLTNRIRHGRDNKALKKLRPSFHDAVVSNLGSDLNSRRYAVSSRSSPMKPKLGFRC